MVKSLVFVIDSACRMLYASYYIQGMADFVGWQNIKFKSKNFKELHDDANNSFEQYFAFIILNEKGNYKKKIVFDYHDSTSIDQKALEWCDLYAKINLNNYNLDLITGGKEKIIPLSPGFGIKLNRNIIYLIFIGLKNYFISGLWNNFPIGRFMAGYVSKKRIELSKYLPAIKDKSNYIFFISSLWNNEYCIKNTNPWRYKFMEIVDKSVEGIEFEGGFVIRSINNHTQNYSQYSLKNSINLKEYIKKISNSFVVFNTPAVHGCHGWKFSEYFALGKAIISTPLCNGLPVNLEHGKNIHFVENEDELLQAILLLKQDCIYRNNLEINALNYFNNILSPLKIISNLYSILV